MMKQMLSQNPCPGVRNRWLIAIASRRKEICDGDRRRTDFHFGDGGPFLGLFQLFSLAGYHELLLSQLLRHRVDRCADVTGVKILQIWTDWASTPWKAECKGCRCVRTASTASRWNNRKSMMGYRGLSGVSLLTWHTLCCSVGNREGEYKGDARDFSLFDGLLRQRATTERGEMR